MACSQQIRHWPAWVCACVVCRCVHERGHFCFVCKQLNYWDTRICWHRAGNMNSRREAPVLRTDKQFVSFTRKYRRKYNEKSSTCSDTFLHLYIWVGYCAWLVIHGVWSSDFLDHKGCSCRICAGRHKATDHSDCSQRVDIVIQSIVCTLVLDETIFLGCWACMVPNGHLFDTFTNITMSELLVNILLWRVS